MINPLHTQLMSYLYKLITHYRNEATEPISFKKRAKLLEDLKAYNENAFDVMQKLIDSHLTFERINGDKEKQAKNTEKWNEEITEAAKQKTISETNINHFLKSNNIS